MKISLIILTIFLLCGVSSSFAQEWVVQDCVMCNYWLNKVHPTTPSSDPADTKLSDQETFDVIRCLLKNKGDKRKANTLTASRSQNNSRLFDTPTREVASLFYISSLFYGNEGFAMAIALEREGDDKLNSKTTVRLAYEAYQKWYEKVKEIGLKEAREQKLDPLARSGVSWY